MLRIAFAGTFPASLEQPVRRHLRTPCDIVVASEADVLPRLPEIDVLVTMGLTPEMARAATRVKLVQVPGAGVDRIDRSALPEGALLANTYGHETGIAEYVIGAMLVLTREFARLDRALRKGDWQSQWALGTPPPPVWPELAGQIVGILGYGRIGQNIARRARAFDMQVCAIRRDVGRSMEDDLMLLGGPDMMHEVLRRADYVVIAMPATVETTGSIGHRELALMKPTAFLINVARAETEQHPRSGLGHANAVFAPCAVVSASPPTVSAIELVFSILRHRLVRGDLKSPPPRYAALVAQAR